MYPNLVIQHMDNMTIMTMLPVIELLWSSPGIHCSFTLLPLCSERITSSGGSGTSKGDNTFYLGLSIDQASRVQSDSLHDYVSFFVFVAIL